MVTDVRDTISGLQTTLDLWRRRN